MNNVIDEFQLLVNDEKVKIISFDIFDTLIQRPFNDPKELFRLLDPIYYRMTCGAIEMSFSKMRIDAEEIARVNHCSNEKQEVNLDEIYDVLCQEFRIDKYNADNLKKREIDIEKELCYAKDIGYKLFKVAQKTGKKIIFISDMYMSKVDIENILCLNHYPVEDVEVYLSSEYRKTKYTGDLFDVIIEENNILGNQLVHVGDNYHADIKMAKDRLITAVYLEKEIDTVKCVDTDWYKKSSKFMKVMLLCLYDREVLMFKIRNYLRSNR